MDFPLYLLRELLYQLEQHRVEIHGLTDVAEEAIEVVSHSGYDLVLVRTAAGVFEARLDWSMKTAPAVEVIVPSKAQIPTFRALSRKLSSSPLAPGVGPADRPRPES